MRFSLPVAAALLGSCLIALPVSAAPVPASTALPVQADGYSLLLHAQAMVGGGQQGGQVRGGGVRGGQVRRGGGGGGRGGYRGGGGGGDGGAVAAGVLGGLLLGAIIANEAQRSQGANYCAQRYRSYDPGSGTFVGRDGRRYRCQ